MQSHKVISAFRDCGRLVEPPGEYVPTSQAQADRLVRAGCLKRPGGGLGAVVAEINADMGNTVAVLTDAAAKLDQHAPEPVAMDEESTPSTGDAPKAPTHGHGKKGRNKR